MSKRSIIGILILGVGLLMLAGSMGYVETRGLWSTFWPVILIAVGFISLTEGTKNYIFSGLLLLFGTLFLLRNLGFDVFLGLDIWDLFWPVILIAVGLWFLTSRGTSFSSVKAESGDDVFEVLSVFSGSDINNVSQNFRGGQATAVFGGADINLRGANVMQRPAKIDVFAAFGGVDIKVPAHWRVKVTGVPIFGGWGNNTALKNDTSREIDLEINAMVLFGGFDVKN